MSRWWILWASIVLVALIACGGASSVQPLPFTSVPSPTAEPTPIDTPSPTIPALEPTSQSEQPSPRTTVPSPTAEPTPIDTPSPTIPALEPTSQSVQADEKAKDDDPAVIEGLRYLALGDSYTIGQSVDASERWPVQLVKRLREDGVIISEPEIVARTGWTTGELAQGIARVNPSGPFDIVTLMIGVNNQFRGLAIEQYRQEFSALLLQSVQFAGAEPSHVIVVSTPDWGVTPFARAFDRDRIALEIDQFNSVALEETTRVGAVFVDVTGVSRLAQSQQNLIAFDGLHPSGEMYSRWVDLIFPAAQGIATRATGDR